MYSNSLMLEHYICGDISRMGFYRLVIMCVGGRWGGEVKEIHCGGIKR